MYFQFISLIIQVFQEIKGGARIFQGGVASTLGLQNQWGMPPKCHNLSTGT